MVGSYNIEVVSSNIKYNINIKYSISIIKGFSGLGKTHLTRILELLFDNKTKTVRCNLKDKLYLLRYETEWEYVLKKYSGKIFIADENVDYIFTREFADLAQTSDNYFIFITRRNLPYFTYSSDAIYTLDGEKEGTIFTNRTINLYKDTVLNNYTPDVILCEDKKSGYEMFISIFNIPVISADGRDNIVTYIKNNKNYNIYVIADGSGFGSCVNEILKLYSGSYTNFKLFLPRSFEYMLLNYPKYKYSIEDMLINTENYCETTKYKSWEIFYTELMCKTAIKYNFTYTKSKLSPKLKFDKMYDNIKSQIKDINKGVFK